MQITLTLTDRITLGSILPVTGNAIDLTIFESIRNKVALKVEEIEKYEIKSEPKDGNTIYTWNADGRVAEFESEFSPSELEKINSALDKLNAESKLDPNSFALFKKFCSKPIPTEECSANA